MTMTPNEIRICLEHLAWSQRGLARLLDLDDRLVRRWASGQNEIPDNIAHWLAMLAAFHAEHPPPAITASLARTAPAPPDQATQLLRTRHGSRPPGNVSVRPHP